MLLPTKSLLAILAAAQLTTLITAGPFPVQGGLHSINGSCTDGRGLNNACNSWPLHSLSDEVANLKVKRGGIEPFIPAKPEPAPEPEPEPVGPEPNTPGGPGPADPLSGGQPIIVRPKPAPAPPAPPKPATAPHPQPVSDPATDEALEPLGNPKGNDGNFNGYAVTGPNKAVAALADAIRTNKPDLQSPRFDVKLDDPENPGQTFQKYKMSTDPGTAPRAGEQIGFFRFGAPAFLGVKAERFEDIDVQLPTSVRQQTGGDNLAAKWARIKFSSTKASDGTLKNPGSNTVADVFANQDGSAIVVNDIKASVDFNDPLTENVPDVNKRLPSSELIVQAAGLVRNPGTASALRVFMQQNVINRGATNTLKKAYQSLGLSLKLDTKGVFQASAGKDTAEGKAFDALMQVKNSEVTNFALADHHQAFGDKVPQKIITFLNNDFSSGSAENSADMFYILGRN